MPVAGLPYQGRIIVVATLLTLFLFAAFIPSSAQEMNTSFLISISQDTIFPGEQVSVRISAMVEPNSPVDIVVRFIAPQGPVQNTPLNFRTDSLGFASQIVDYPNDIANASTEQRGNYTVLVQDLQSARLVASDSFKVTEPESFLNFISQSQTILTSIVVAGAGGLLTYWYNRLSANRETKVTLNQKKSESFLALRPHYAYVTRSTTGIEQLARELQGKNDDNDDIKRKYLLCFYFLIIYVRERNVLIDKFGAYFLSDPRGEKWLATVETNLINHLRTLFTPLGFAELGQVLSREQSLSDLEVELRRNYSAYELYERFKNCIKNNRPKEDVDKFICDLKLFYTIINYETSKMFRDWYPQKEGVNDNIYDLKNTLISEFKKDPRYCTFKLDYLIDQ